VMITGDTWRFAPVCSVPRITISYHQYSSPVLITIFES